MWTLACIALGVIAVVGSIIVVVLRALMNAPIDYDLY